MRRYIRNLVLAVAVAALTTGAGSAQLGDIGNILTGGVENAELMFTEYLRPLANSLGANLNGGWYNTAKVHGTLGFDITMTVSAAFPPDDSKLYDLSKLGLTDLAPMSNPNAPTYSGAAGGGPTVAFERDVPGYFDNPVRYLEFDHPGGSGISFVPSPMINAGLGIPKGFEVMGRFMPKLKYKGLEFGLWGVGVKHDIGQWIPFVKRIPVLHFTLMYGYTNIHANAKLKTISPDLLTPSVADNTSGINWDGQNLDLVTQGHTANFLVGANLPVVAFYGGVGISKTRTNLKANGYYPVPTLNTDNPLNPYTEVTNESAVKDPIDIEIKNTDGSTTSPRLNAGIRFKFAVVTIHFDYTYANYSVATAGLGFSFR
jgi:hypothetical protein